MKNSIRRLISLATVLALLILSVAVLSSCYVVKSGKMNRVEGVYKLTTYSGKTNYLEERGIEMYMIIRADGGGYYAYKDNDTAPYISELRVSYESDPEESGKYSYVNIKFTGSDDPAHFAVYAPTFDFNTNLNSQKPVWKPIVWGETPEIDYYIDVDFTRVEKSTELDALKELFGDAPLLPYDAKRYDGTYKLERIVAPPESAETPENPYVYYYVTLDFVAKQAKIYNMKKDDEIASTATLNDLSVSYENGNYIVSMGGKSYLINTVSSQFSYSLDIEESFEGGSYTLCFHHWHDMTEEQILDSIENDVNNYLASKDFSE